MRTQRVESPGSNVRARPVDVFLGVCVAGLILVNNPGDREAVFPALRPAVWQGCTFADVWPALLLFGVGLATSLRLDALRGLGTGRWTAAVWVLPRVLFLFVLGLTLNGFPWSDFASLRYTGFLQRIALCFGAAGLSVVLVARPRPLVLLAVILVLAHWGVMTRARVPIFGAGNLSRPGNVAALADRKMFKQHIYMADFDPEGVTATIPAVATTLLGAACGLWLGGGRTGRSKIAGLALAGAVGVPAGLAWGHWYPIIPTLWTGSYVGLTAGIATLVLASILFVVDLWDQSAWARPFSALGAYPLAVYYFSQLLARGLMLWAPGDPGLPVVDFAAVARDDSSPFVRAEALRRIRTPRAREVILSALGSNDAFLRQAAQVGLGQSLGLQALRALAKSPDPGYRIAAVLALRESGSIKAAEALPGLLNDPDPVIRQAAVQWVGDKGLVPYRGKVQELMASPSLDRAQFESCLAAIVMLDQPRDRSGHDIGGALREMTGQDAIAGVVQDRRASATVRRRALRSLRSDHVSLAGSGLDELLASTDEGLRAESVYTLRESSVPGRGGRLLGLAEDANQPEEIRAEAVAGLSGGEAGEVDALIKIALNDPSPGVRRQAFRSLRGLALSAEKRARLRGLPTEPLLDPGRFAVDPPDAPSWAALLAVGGDSAEGERVFFHPKGPGCYRCHEIDGRGGRVGPDLTTFGRTVTPEKILTSILRPSLEIASQYVVWSIALRDGKVIVGIPTSGASEGSQSYVGADGRVVTLNAEEIEERQPSPTSMMPGDLARMMTRQELGDLIAFLRHPESRAKSTRAANEPGRPSQVESESRDGKFSTSSGSAR